MCKDFKIKTPVFGGLRANSGDRTRDLTITNRLLYQLSYVGAACIIPVSRMNGKIFLTGRDIRT